MVSGRRLHLEGAARGLHLHIYNDERYDRLNLRILELMRMVKPGSRPHTRLVPGCVISTVSWKHWPCLFPQHGPGRKHERRIALEDWQEEIVRAFPAAFLRGLFHSDGARVSHGAARVVAGEKRRHAYPPAADRPEGLSQLRRR